MRKVRIEIRADSVVIDGYVNAVERDSKVLHDQKGAFVEKIKSGAFQRALERAKVTGYDVKVLLNHDYGRQLTSANEKSTCIREDNIGLRCKCEIRDAESAITRSSTAKAATTSILKTWSGGRQGPKQN